MTKEEQSILNYFVDKMELEGVKYNLVWIDFDENTLNEINTVYKIDIKMDDREKLLNKLISHEFVQYSYFGGEEFSGIQITQKGMAIVSSLRAKEEQRRNRKMVKKISDAIEDHKGLATFIGLLITASIGVVTLILKIKGCE